MAKRLPWDYHPALTEDRLIAVGLMLLDGRRTAVDLYDEEAGDNGWTLGCRAFQFCRARILRAVIDGTYGWLGVIDRSLQLIFTIGGVPVRIYRGEAEEPTERTTRECMNELRQRSFSFQEFEEGRELAYRFAIETDADGSVLAVRFVGLRGKTACLDWEVPLSTGTGSVGKPATEPVELNPPTVRVPTREQVTRD
jgi:hypothetical protein